MKGAYNKFDAPRPAWLFEGSDHTYKVISGCSTIKTSLTIVLRLIYVKRTTIDVLGRRKHFILCKGIELYKRNGGIE